jgi:uncharacterized membrane protein
MTRKGLMIASTAIVLAMVAVALYVGRGLPGDMRLPIHWNLAGTADGYASKWNALLTPAVITALTSILLYFLPALEPREGNLARSQGLYLWSWAGTLLVMLALDLVVVSTALHWGLRVEHVITGAVGMMLVLIGNQLGKSRSMFLVGIRTPWALSSEEVWIKTHRLGGKLMVGGGAALILAALLPIPSGLLAMVFMLVIAVTALVPIVYSYLLWRREKRSAQPRG